MSEIRLINKFPADEKFTYDKRIKLLRETKIKQTEEKARNGGANEDDYGLIVQDEFDYKLKPNHPNGSAIRLGLKTTALYLIHIPFIVIL